MSKTYHFIGIGGIGMSALARILINQKAEVSGSDIVLSTITDELRQAGATIYQGQAAEHVTPHTTVVYSSDIQKNNPEYLAAIHKQCILLHRSDLLAQLLEQHRALAVTGTHGKTTTTALLAAVLVEAGLDPSFAVGGMLKQFHAHSRFGQGSLFAFEADESDGTFLNYFPYGAIVTNIDRDHLNNFQGSEKSLVEAFKTFMSQITSFEHLFWCGDDPHLMALNQPGQRYGFSHGCDWRVSRLRQEGFQIIFDIDGKGSHYQDVEVALIGQHNALNALAVFGLARTLGIEEGIIRQTFKTFQGIMRRCERKGERDGILFLDDYAHHPTEIELTLKAIRQAIGERRLVTVFQPHRYSRTQDCLDLYGPIFEVVDELIITDIYGAGETPIPHLSHAQIFEEIKYSSSVPIRYVPRAELSQQLAQVVRPHDVVVTLGAGDVTRVGPDTLALLYQQPPPRLKLGLIFGGASTEHEVSLSSSQHFRESLQQNYYEIEEFGITRKGTWIAGSDAKQRLENILNGQEEDRNFPLLSSETLQKLMACDVLVPVLHGPFGEDGTIQGFFEVLKKAYTGCDHRSAAISMDKLACKKLVILEGMHTSPFVDFSSYQWKMQAEALQKQIREKLSFPVFVKPIHLGSTIGITKVMDPTQLKEAISHAFCYDTHVLVENGIHGRELEFAVLGTNEIQVFPPGEILTGGAVYDYQAKYSKNGMKTTPCADLPLPLIEKGRQLAEKAYRAIGCCGLARVDFFLDSQGTYWFNEINPLPGFTSLSLYPQICAYHGLMGSDLMDRLIILALYKKRQCEKINSKLHIIKSVEIY